MVAWPSKGITLLETLDNLNFAWSAKFYNSYIVTDETTVNVKCLQTGEEWNFDTIDKSESNYFRRDGNNSTEEFKNRVIFKNETLIPQPGFVYEITIKNLTDLNTDSAVDYIYRSRFEYGMKVKKIQHQTILQLILMG